MSAPPGCRLLAWDSAFFGRPIARIESDRLDAPELRRLVAAARESRIACLTWLVPLAHVGSLRAAGLCGFRPMDVRVTLVRMPVAGEDLEAKGCSGVRPFAPGDVERLAAIARCSHRISRFYADPGFPDARCDDLYETWIRNACAGEADAVLVAGEDGAAHGYLTCGREEGGGRIGLFAVDAAARGRGLGSALVDAGLAWFAAAGAAPVRVATQGRNDAALRLYGSRGFRTESAAAWLHLWPDAGATA